LAGCLLGWLVGWLLAGWLVGWLVVGWLVGWLVGGWLVGCLLEPTGEVRKTTLTPLHIVLLDKLIVAELFNYFPTFSATRMFFIIFKTPGHWFLYQSTFPVLFKIHFNIILQSTFQSSKLSLSFRFIHLKALYICIVLYTCHVPRPVVIKLKVQIMCCLPSSVTSFSVQTSPSASVILLLASEASKCFNEWVIINCCWSAVTLFYCNCCQF